MPERLSQQTRAVSSLVGRIRSLAGELCPRGSSEPIRLMEVCGTHTMAISEFGIRRMLEPHLKLLSGPGCPVCVTSEREIDECIRLAQGGEARIRRAATKPRTVGTRTTESCRRAPVVLTFGDMLRVPGRLGSLEKARAAGADVRVVYSPLDGVRMAEGEPEKEFIFLGVGFETTAPTVAAALLAAHSRRVRNLTLLPMFKLVPPALRFIAGSKSIAVDGFILPGHVSTVIGTEPYRFLAADFGLPSCVAGFDATDILEAILSLMVQLREGARVDNQYRRSVRPEGNPRARQLMSRVFRVCDAEWRGLGVLPESGLELRPEFARYDARPRAMADGTRRGGSEQGGGRGPRRAAFACRCGDVMLGLIVPTDCRLFGRACTPESPVGPCMVSSEGACAAYWKYGG